MTIFGTQLLHWYSTYKRSLPWRETSDPYKIWISEIILQQTQVKQGLEYYHQFINHYPSIQDLAKAPEDEILRLWQGLGYYSRARNLHSTAKAIVKHYNGIFPNNYKDILNLKGIGPYTAAAIASIAYNQPYAVVDGNVYRFLARLKGIETPIDSTEGKKRFATLANTLLNQKEPGMHNQAMMEMGALICKPQNPDCSNCPFHTQCTAYQTGHISDLPVKTKKTKQRQRYFNYFLTAPNDQTILINKRNSKDIWQNLYQLPLFESDKKVSSKFFENKVNKSFSLLKETKHTLSHQVIHTNFFSTSMDGLLKLGLTDLEEINSSKCARYAFPQVIVNFLSEQKLPGYGTT